MARKKTKKRGPKPMDLGEKINIQLYADDDQWLRRLAQKKGKPMTRVLRNCIAVSRQMGEAFG